MRGQERAKKSDKGANKVSRPAGGGACLSGPPAQGGLRPSDRTHAGAENVSLGNRPAAQNAAFLAKCARRLPEKEPSKGLERAGPAVSHFVSHFCVDMSELVDKTYPEKYFKTLTETRSSEKRKKEETRDASQV